MNTTLPANLDPLLRIDEVRAVVPYSASWIYRKMKVGEFPKQVRLGPNRVGWLASDIRAWCEQRQAAND